MAKLITSSNNSSEIQLVILLYTLCSNKKNGLCLNKLNYIFYVIKNNIDIDKNKTNFLPIYSIDKSLKKTIVIAKENNLIEFNNLEKDIRIKILKKGLVLVKTLKYKKLFNEINDKAEFLSKTVTQRKLMSNSMVWL